MNDFPTGAVGLGQRRTIATRGRNPKNPTVRKDNRSITAPSPGGNDVTGFAQSLGRPSGNLDPLQRERLFRCDAKCKGAAIRRPEREGRAVGAQKPGTRRV